MAIVGYSDVYRTAHGFVGGYILKNSWWDGLPPEHLGGGWKHARGSHTVAFFMQHVSDDDEMRICPNCHSPRSWLQCDTLSECRSNETKVAAKKSRAPLNLECIDQSPFVRGLCKKGDGYFLQSISTHSTGLHVACFLRDAEDSTRVCSPPVPLEDLALVFSPVKGECQPNDPQLCGFYFFPYELLEEIDATYRGFEVSDMDVEWEPEAFAANSNAATKKEGLDYALVERNTHTQREMKFTGPTPLLHDPPGLGY